MAFHTLMRYKYAYYLCAIKKSFTTQVFHEKWRACGEKVPIATCVQT